MAERGLAAPLEDIAAAAGVGIGTLYRRFPTRDELIQALFLDRVESFLSDLETAVAMDDGWEGFVWFMRRSVSRQIDDRALSELLWHDAADGLLRDLRERVWPLAEELVRRAQATGRLRPDLTASDVALLQQMVVHVGELLRPVNDDAWQRVFVLVLDGMVTSRPGPAELRWPAPTVDELDEVRCGVKGRPLPGRPG
jgi:AcrR family transcriptional regulator